MAVALNSSNVQHGRNDLNSSVTVSHTTPASNNSVLIVKLTWYDASVTSTSVVFNGSESLTKHAAYTAGAYNVEFWRLINPSSSTTANVVCTMSGAVSGGLAAICETVTGADQTNPLGTLSTQSGIWYTSANDPTLSITSTTGDMVTDCLLTDTNNATVGSGQTLRVTDTGGFVPEVHDSTAPGASSVTMTWTTLDLFSNYVYAALNIAQAAAGRTAKNTHPRPLGIRPGASRGLNLPGAMYAPVLVGRSYHLIGSRWSTWRKRAA
jgi:hypothetical protein